MKKKFLFIIISIFIFSCSEESRSICKSLKGYDKKESENIVDSLVSNLTCIQLESSPECTLSTLSKLEMTDSLIIISDMEHVFAFTRDGKFLHQYGEKGNAENEYITIHTFMLDDNDNVVIVDSYSGKLLTFLPNGQFQSATKIGNELLSNIQDACFIGKDSIFASKYIYNDQNTAFEIIDLKRKKSEEIAKTPVKTDNTMERIGRHPFSNFERNIRYILPFEPIIYNIHGCDYEIQTSEEIYRNRELADISDFSIMTYLNALKNKIFTGFTDIFETSHSIFLFCSNLDCTIIDKSARTCHRFSTQNKEIYSALPLIGIIAEHNDILIGAIQPSLLENMNISDDCSKHLDLLNKMKHSMDKNGNPIILLYTIPNVSKQHR